MSSGPRVVVHDLDDRWIVAASGGLYGDVSAPLRHRLAALLAMPHPRIVLDLSRVTACDAGVLSLLVQTHRQANGAGGWLHLAAPRPFVRQILDITRLAEVVPVYPRLREALTDPATAS